MKTQRVEKTVNTVLAKYNPQGLTPFPFENIQKDKDDLEIYLVDLDEELSGAIGFNAKSRKFEIFVNRKKPQNRQNFTLAHELGHYFLHQEIIRSEETLIDGEDTDINLFRVDEGSSTQIEREANEFAADILMPAEFVNRAWEAIGNVEECAALFHVSIAAMSIRLERLGLV